MVTLDITSYCGASFTKDIEILACKISKHKDQHIVLDLDVEGWDIVENGIEQVVKNICDELEMSYTQIEFISSDRLSKSTVFKHTPHKELMNFWKDRCYNPNDIDLPIANKYGLFLGRATNERLYSFWKHKNWQYSDSGKASMHLDPDTVTEWDSDFTSFVCEHNERWQSLVPMLPYSDTGHSIDPATMKNEEGTGLGPGLDTWNQIYRDVSIDIVCETNTTADTFFITEKTFRPIAHGRLFMVIGSPEFEQNLKRMGFDIFDDIIDKSYDSESSYYRVDAVFKSLGDLLRNPVDMQALLPRLQANQRVLEKS
jgi:hypothetical protein